ncbi:MAG: transcription antitermination factor NusB [Planctomycetota bacterium]|jgi:16S rRNA (cytosine967-C5)-methyltransferase
MAPDSARYLVASRVAQRAERFPQLFPEQLRTGGLAGRDAALAHAIDQAVARRWLTLAAVLQAQLNRPWERLQPAVQSALLVGAAQLLLLERLPDHAVINESVAWVKRKSPAAAGIVNAVLRRTADLRGQRLDDRGSLPLSRNDLPLHDGRVLRLEAPVFDEDPLGRLAQQTSHPLELLSRWVQRYGLEQAAALADHGLVHPPIIVTGAPGEPRSGLAGHDEPGFAVFGGGRADLDALLVRHPGARVQDPGSAAAVIATGDLEPDLIIEVCAGRGTKTCQLAQIHPQARIVASDTSPHRLAALRTLFDGHDRVLVVEPDGLLEFAGKADLVVVDPPCSNTAVLARRVEAKYRFGPRGLRQLQELQRQITADALRLLAAAGHLLYSTCSLEPQENDQQIEWVQRWHRLRPKRQVCQQPQGVPGDPPSRYRDGCFFGLLTRE